MIKRLKDILTQGISDALKQQSESINHSFIMKGKGDAFREVLLVIDQLEKHHDSEDSASGEEKEAKE